MNHPKIIAGRHGLPATSNIPWSIAGELELRRQILFYFVGAWGLFLGAGVLFMIRDWLAGTVCTVCCGIAAFAVSDLRRMLHAMLLNKPRTSEGLTQWSEHSLLCAPAVHCPCGEKHDLIQPGNYFGETKRFSVVCKCGRGHFCQMGPFSNFRGVKYEK